jgi:serine/threonine protein kinase
VFGSGWRLRERLRAGGMAEVYLAERPDGERRAIKRLLPHLEGQARLAGALEEEARLGRSIRHANVVRVDGFERDGGRGHIVMEYVDGVDLAVLRARARALHREVPLMVVAALMAQAGAALAHAHGSGIVHGDVSPGNLLVTMGCATAGVLKLCDFGLARRRAGSHPEASPLGASTAYVAPEQVGDGNAVRAGDDRSDVWSLGVCAWELVAGRRLFGSGRGRRDETLARIRRFVPPPLERVRPGVPRSLSALITGALARDPAARPPALTLGERFTAWYAARRNGAGDGRLAAWLGSLDEERPAAAPALSPTTLVDDLPGA